MATNGKVHPGCVNASNPYHECGVACLEKIAQGAGWKDKKKSDRRNALKEITKKIDEGRRGFPTCPKASNPYHECDERCTNKAIEANRQGVKKESDNRNRINGGEVGKKVDGGRTSHPTCPKASNPYHECDERCPTKAIEANGRGVKKESDNRNGINGGEIGKKVDGGRTAHPACPRASNPYHECDERCSNKASEANPWVLNKESDNRNGIKGGEITKKIDGGRTALPTCPKASNPYHECDKYCSNTSTEPNPQEVNEEPGSFLSASLSFGKKKESESQPISPRTGNNVSAVKAVYPRNTQSPRLPLPTKKKVDSETSASFSSTQQHSEESYFQDHSLDNGKPIPSELVPISGIATPHGSKSPGGSITRSTNGTPTEKEEKEKPLASPKPSQLVSKKEQEAINGALFGSLNFSLSGISRASGGSDDDEDADSVISDSYVPVGNYHVRSNVASILQSIFDKHGDIASKCRLQSSVMRAYYLESLCSVIQDLQSTSFKQLTKSKIKDMLAVLKDVESAQIDVSWLQSVLNELTEALELNNQHEAAEVAKVKCDQTMESMRNALETMIQDFAEKEKELAEAKARIEETRARLSELELESSQLGDTISSMRAKVDKFSNKPLTDGIL